MTELEEIIQKMINAGESEENIDMVVAEYESMPKLAKTEAVAMETADVTAVEGAVDKVIDTDLKLEDGSLESRPIEKNTWLEDFFGETEDTEDGLPGVDFLSDLYRAGKTGWAQGSTVGEAFDLWKPLTEDTIDNYIKAGRELEAAGGPSKEQINASARVLELKKEGSSPIMAIMEAYWENPSAIAAVAVSSMASMAAGIVDSEEVAGAAATGAVAGGVAGGAIGATGFAAGPLGIATTIGGALSGSLRVGMSALSGALETGLTTAQLVEEQAKEMDPEKSWQSLSDKERAAHLRKVIGDEKLFNDLKNKALRRGLTIGAIGLITAGATGAVGRKASSKLASSVLSRATKQGKNIAQGITETIGESSGEALGQLAAGQEFNLEEIVLEGIAGKETTITKGVLGINKGNPKYSINGEQLNGKQFADTLAIMDDATIMEADIKVKNSPGVEQVLTNRIQDINVDQKVDSRISGVEDRAAAIKLTKEKEKLLPNPQGNKSRLAEINKQLEDINATYKDSNVDVTIQQRQEAVAKAVDNKFESRFNKNLKAVESSAKELGFEQGPQVFDTTEAFVKAVADAVFNGDIELAKLELVKDEQGNKISTNGAFLGNGRIFIDKTVAKQQGEISVASHELLHPILYAALGGDVQQAKMVKRFKKRLSKDQRAYVEKRIAEAGDEAKTGTEYLTYFSDGIQRGDIEYDVNLFTKLKDVVIDTFVDLGYENISFKNSRGVYNFLKEYNNSIKNEGKISDKAKAAIVKAEKKNKNLSATVDPGDINASKTVNELNTELDELIDDEFSFLDASDFEAQKSNLEFKIRKAKEKGDTKSVKKVTVKETIEESADKVLKKESKPKKVYNNEKLIETIKSENISSKEKAIAEADLVESFDAMALNAIKYDTRKGDYDRTEVRDYLRGFFPTILKSYNPNEAKFSTWVYNNIAPKAQQTYEKFKKIADKSLDAEAGSVGSVKEAVAEISTTTEVATDKASRKIKPIELVRSPESKKKYKEAIKKIVESGKVSVDKSTFGNLKDLATEVTAEIFDIPILKVTDPADNLTYKDVIVDNSNINKIKKYYPDAKVGMVIKSESSKIQDVIKSMGIDLFKLLPPENVSPELASVDAQAYKPIKGTGLKIPSSLMKVFYEATGKRSKGVTSQTAIKKLKKGLTYEQFLKELGIVKGQPNTYDRAIGQRLKAITTLFGKLATNTEIRQLEDITDVQKQNIESGKSDIMFSKSLDIGLQPSSNHDSLLEIQFSKKKRLEYENVLKKKRPELKNIPKQVENLFEWADNLDVTDNQKPKYKKLALYYTANGYTIFPEDGYKIEEVIRLAAINKIDPYAYKNPDELINKYTKEVLAVKINPDNVPEFSNKEVYEDGLVIYDVEDSKKGQRAVRGIVDSYWGENSNPWCLIARNKKVENEILDDFKTESEAKEHSRTLRDYWTTDSFVTFDDALGRWLVVKGNNEDSDVLSKAWTMWKQYNMNGAGYGYKIAFQKGKLLSFRDGGQQTNDDGNYEVEDFANDDESQWWDRFDKPTDNLTISLGKDKDTGYKIIGSIDYEGYTDISGYGEGDFMSRKNNYKLYDVDKNLVEAQAFKDGKISSSTKISRGKMFIGNAKTVEQVDNKYTDGKLVLTEFTSKKVSKDSSVLDKDRKITQEYLSDNLVIKDIEATSYKDGVKKLTRRSITLITQSPSQINSEEYYRETITDGVKVISLDKMSELQDIKKSNIQFSKSVEKAAISNNNMLPKSQRLKGNFTNQDVLNKISDLDDEINKAELNFSKSIAPDLNKKFNEILENKTSIAAGETIGEVKAALMGQNKGRFNFFIPPSAEDFVGLLYKTLAKGKKGDAQMKFYKENLLDPFARGVANVTRDRNILGRNFKALKKELKIIPKDLKKKLKGNLFTKEQAVRVYIWDAIGATIPGLTETDLKELVDMVKADPKLEQFAIEVMKLNKGSAYAKPSDTWVTGTITTDLLEALNTTRRKTYLELWQSNVDTIFSKENRNKLEAAFGKSYRVAIDNILKRMETGTNRTFGGDTLTGRFTDWLNGSVAAIMFFNSRSAILQTISAINFINFTDNNVIAAGKAFANQPQFWSDFKKLFNSDFLVERRDGLKINVNESDIANIAKENGVRGVIGKLLKLGFTPTQLADSFAIASGGSTFYRNRLESLIKGGMDPVAAEKQAMRDFRETAEESQQSSRADKISQQQAGPLGRIVLAFANTPAQYARLIKKAASDLRNGRGDVKTNVSKILYYGVLQNLLFNYLQQALFSVSFGDDEEELKGSEGKKNAKRKEDKIYNIANGMVDSVARGTGVGGAIFTVVKNAVVKLHKETQKKSPEYEDVALELLKISPPISSKVGKTQSAGRTFSWDMKEIKKKGFSIDNPANLAIGNVIAASTNVPLDRLIKKVDNIVASTDENIEAYKRIFLLLGWTKWELGIDENKPKKTTSKSNTRSKRIGKSRKGIL